jgi:hypothetical protein
MDIDRNEVLRYLGYKNSFIDNETNKIINECILEIKEFANINYIYKVFDIEKEAIGIKISKTNLWLKGNDINLHLKDSKSCAIMAVTLGALVDTKIRYYEKINITKSLILDACATTLVEEVCGKVEKEIRAYAETQCKKNITYRYSPGYGDLPLNIQIDILNILDAYKRIGLTATESYILTPAKSVTAIIGFIDRSIIPLYPGCSACKNYLFCDYRKDGNYCGD